MKIQKTRKDGITQRYHVRNKLAKIKGQKQVILFKKGKAQPVNLRPIPQEKYARNFKTKIKLIPIDEIEPLEEIHYKNRRKIDEIKNSRDILKPVKVHNKYSPEQKYQLWDGHHRYIAAKERGDKYIPALINLNKALHKIWRKKQEKNDK